MAAGYFQQIKTGIAKLDGVLSGASWDTTDLTYSFPDGSGDYENDYFDNAAKNNAKPLNADQRDAVESVLAQLESFTLLTFTDVTATASLNTASPNYSDLRFAISKVVNPAYAYYPDDADAFSAGGDSFFHGGSDFSNMKPGSYGFSTFLHETGHALGLKHGHERDGGFPALPHSIDSLEFTVMTYRSYVGGSIQGGFDNETYGFPQSYMMLDIAALQEMYGANYTTNGTDTVYSFDRSTGQEFIDNVGQTDAGGNRVFRTIWDGGGEDTYDFSNYHTNLVIRLDPGSWSLTSKAQLALLDRGTHHFARANVFNALLHDGDERSLIENAIGGSGRDRLIRNIADNELTGNGGGDTISGKDGSDHLIGGLGADILSGGADADFFIFDNVLDSCVGKTRDWIKDFNASEGDQIDLTQIEADTSTAFHFIGTADFGAAGDMRLFRGVLSIDIDGDTVADFQIKVAGILSDANFV